MNLQSRVLANQRLEKSINISKVCNYYGGLRIIEEDNKYYWFIENYDAPQKEDIEEISQSLYESLIKFKTDRDGL